MGKIAGHGPQHLAPGGTRGISQTHMSDGGRMKGTTENRYSPDLR
jgi:hypothetical protein